MRLTAGYQSDVFVEALDAFLSQFAAKLSGLIKPTTAVDSTEAALDNAFQVGRAPVAALSAARRAPKGNALSRSSLPPPRPPCLRFTTSTSR